jgi:DNA polymerase-1
MQGTAADIIKNAMISVDDWLETSRLPARLVMQVHDELVLEVEKAELGTVSDGVIKHMSAAAKLDVKLVVDVGSGPDWDTAH